MMDTVISGTHAGIASYSMTGTGICTGTLVFGVGLRDEPAALAGITHLIEHVLLRMVHPMPIWHGGLTGMDSVEFHATGQSDEVAGFLNAIASAICRFPAVSEQDLELGKSVIEAENPAAFWQVSSGLLTYRFGAKGPGAGQFGAPSTFGLSRAEAIDWVDRWFTTENAIVTFTDAIPESLSIQLPQGERITREHHEPQIMTPTVIRSSKNGVALSLVVPRDESTLLGEALRYELLDRLSHVHGLIYSVDIISTLIDGGRCQLDLVLDPVDLNVPEAFSAGVKAVQDVAANGFSAYAMQQACSIRQAELALQGGFRANSAYLDQLAIDRLLGRPTSTPQKLLHRAATITAEELTQILRTALDSLVVAVDRYTKVRKKEIKALGMTLEPYTIWEPRTQDPDEDSEQEPTSQRLRWRHKSSKAALRLTPTHLWHRQSVKTKSIDLSDIVVVGERTCGCLSLMDSRGRSTELATEEWKRGKKLKQALLSLFPAGTIRKFPDR